MKSFIAYPIEFETLLSSTGNKHLDDPLAASHTNIFSQVKHLEGIIVKCGITKKEGFARFASIKTMVGEKLTRKMVAFEKKKERTTGSTGFGYEYEYAY